jgi:hypothetical protein
MPISHAKSDTLADWSGAVTVNNSLGIATTMAGSDLVRPSDWNSAHVVSLSASEVAGIFVFNNGLSSTTAAGGITAGIDFVDYWEPFIPPNTNSTLSAPGIGTWYFDPFCTPFGLNSGQINMLGGDAAGFLHGAAYSAASTGSLSRSQTFNNVIAIYRLGAGANSTRLESIWSADCSVLASWEIRLSTANTSSGTISNFLTLSFPSQWNISGGVTYGSTSASGTTAVTASTMASTRANNLITGALPYLTGSRMDIFPFATTLPAGEYWFAHMFSSTSASAGTVGGIGNAGTMFSTHSRLHMLEFVGQAYKQMGKSTSDTSSDFQKFHGSLATTTSAPTSAVATSDLRNLLTNHRVYWAYERTSY